MLSKLLQLAEHASLKERRNALVAGDIVNPTENRPALHAWLRTDGSRMISSTPHESHEWLQGLHDMLALAEAI